MELIIWRHAEAEVGSPDMTRRLTERGRRQATRMAKWLNQRLPEDVLILVSPSQRTLETAEALARPFQVHPDLAPDANADAVLHTIGWPDAPHPVLIVGHQPYAGHIIMKLLSGKNGEFSLKKGAIAWMQQRPREEAAQTLLRAVLSPDLL
jgi:phosphohistidine phosphatase